MDPRHYPMSQYANTIHPHNPGWDSNQCQLTVRQQPRIGKVAVGEEKNRKPVDPPPVVQLKIKRDADPEQSYLQSPYFFVSCILVQPPGSLAPQPSGSSLAGTLVSSLHRLKDPDNGESAFFIFGDLSVKVEGKFSLQFNLYEMRESDCYHVCSILSDPFPVHGPKQFPGLSESTPLTRYFSEQGVRLRVRKEPRTLLRKRGPASDNYVPRSYNRRQETSEEQVEDVDSPVSSRHSQVEQQGSIQSPLEGPRGQQMLPVRGYSQQPVRPHGSYSEEPLVKRPRTASEQGLQHGFGQQSQQSPFVQQSQQMAYGQQRPAPPVTPLESPSGNKPSKDSDRKQSSYGSYPQNFSQQHGYGYQYAQSPTAVRDTGGYFPQARFNPQEGAISPSIQQPTHSFPPQPHAQYQYGQATMQGVNDPYSNMGMTQPSRTSGMGEDMAQSQFARTPSNAAYASMMGGEQRFMNVNPNISTGNMREGPSRSGSIPITTGPASMDSTYQ